MPIEETSIQNAEFWNELCGSHLAKSLGIADSSQESLKRFDDWYFDFYPYLFKHIPFDKIAGLNILEVGLGYGTVAQRLAESGSNYIGLDIAAGPVEMVNHRLGQKSLPGKAIQGSILSPQFESNSFDAIVAIGCLHHTGNLQLAIDQCWKLLRTGGTLIFMVYNAYSYRRFRMAPITTVRYRVRELLGFRGVVGVSGEAERAAYDAGATGDGAPHTDWISIRSLRHLCREFAAFSATVENIAQEIPFIWPRRDALLKTSFPHLVGLDVYVTATK